MDSQELSFSGTVQGTRLGPWYLWFMDLYGRYIIILLSIVKQPYSSWGLFFEVFFFRGLECSMWPKSVAIRFPAPSWINGGNELNEPLCFCPISSIPHWSTHSLACLASYHVRFHKMMVDAEQKIGDAPNSLGMEAAGFELALCICRMGMDLCSQPALTNILPPFLVAIGHLQSIPTATHFGGTKSLRCHQTWLGQSPMDVFRSENHLKKG